MRTRSLQGGNKTKPDPFSLVSNFGDYFTKNIGKMDHAVASGYKWWVETGELLVLPRWAGSL